MKIGVLSDTHDNLTNIRRAVEVFLDRKIQAVLHGGDFCSPFTLQEFKPLAATGARMYAVFGNNDGDKLLLTKKGEGICDFRDGAYVLTIDGRRIALIHYPDLAEDLFRSGSFDLVVFGHTHQVRMEGTNKKLLNPGDSSGYLSEKASIAVVDTAQMAAEIILL